MTKPRLLAGLALALLLGPAPWCIGAGQAPDAFMAPNAAAWAMAAGTGVSGTTGLAAPQAVSPTPGASVPQAIAPPALGPKLWRLSLPGKAPVVLRPLGTSPVPLYSIRKSAGFAGLKLRWISPEKTLEIISGNGVPGRLVLGNAYLALRGRRHALPSALQLAQGAPSLTLPAMQALIQAMGGSQPRWTAVSETELSLAPPAAGGPPAIPKGAPAAQAQAEPTEQPAPVPAPYVAPTSTAHVAARPLTGAAIRTIVVDAGHGGKDPGAHGPDGLHEKDVCLDIALRLRRELLERDPGLRVVLTRDNDYFVTLEERTRMANRAKGDLFVSIHNNASPDSDTHGTQVFFFDSQSSDRAASDLSMRENAEANQLDILMTDLAKSIVRDQSIGFASLVQRALGHAINLKHRDISYAPFYVLARTEMPAILVEVAFITNRREERLLGDSQFRQRVAASIAKGIEDYARLAQEKR